MHPRIPAVAGLTLVTAVWGLTFVVMKEAIRQVPPYGFLAMRFGLAALTLAAIFPHRIPHLRTASRGGWWAGLALTVGYGAQTLGLRYIGATESGFITGLMVIFTPLIAAVVLRTRPTLEAGGAAVAATAGLFLLLGGRAGLGEGAGTGAALTTLCAFSFAVHVLVLARFSPTHDPRDLTMVQMIVAALIFTAASLSTENMRVTASSTVVGAVLLTGIAASAGAFLIMTWAQKHLSATQTAVTLTMEPVFAGIAGAVFLAERLDAAGVAGALLILLAMIGVNVADRERA